MKRLHLFELADLPWWPQPLRRAMTEYLSYVSITYDFYGAMLEPLASALRHTGSRRILDLCSGSGGPWAALLPQLHAMVPLEQVVLSDRFPSALPPLPEESSELLSYHPHPLDAQQVGGRQPGFRTMWNAFHHFDEQQGSAVLQDAVREGEGIAIFEGVERSAKSVLQMLFLVPLLVFIDTLRLRPLRPLRLTLTYLLPLLPFATAFDGAISCLRSYTAEELYQLARQSDPRGLYHWECGVDRSHRMSAITYLIGYPKGSTGEA